MKCTVQNCLSSIRIIQSSKQCWLLITQWKLCWCESSSDDASHTRSCSSLSFCYWWLWTLYAVSLKAVKFIDQRPVMSFITLPGANSVWWARWWIRLKFWNLFQPLLKSFTIVCFSDFFYFAFQEYFPWKVKEKWLRKTEKIQAWIWFLPILVVFVCLFLCCIFYPPSRFFRKIFLLSQEIWMSVFLQMKSSCQVYSI